MFNEMTMAQPSASNSNPNRLKSLSEFQFVFLLFPLLLSLFLAGCGDDDETTRVEGVIEVGAILLDKSTLELKVGEEKKLNATLAPENADNKNIRWESDNPQVATVNADGLVHARSQGQAVIRAISEDGNKTAPCTVTVVLPVEALSLEHCPATMILGSQEQLKAVIEPHDATHQALTWASDNPEVATVDAAGLVHAVSQGQAVIRAISEDDNTTAPCTVTVVLPATGLSLERCPATLYVGSEEQLRVTLSGSQALTWASDAPAVATVDENGFVRALALGEVRISVHLQEDAEKTTSCTLRVIAPVDGMRIDGCLAGVPLPSGQTRQLTASEGAVRWESKDTAVATVDSSGLVRAGNTAGTAVIRATTNDGSQTDFCFVTVSIPVTSVSIDGCSTASVVPDLTKPLSANVLPANATNKEVRWESSNPAVATVSNTGVVLALLSGDVTITARSSDGSQTATCDVSVRHVVSSFSFSHCRGKNAPVYIINGQGFKNIQRVEACQNNSTCFSLSGGWTYTVLSSTQMELSCSNGVLGDSIAALRITVNDIPATSPSIVPLPTNICP